MAARTRRELGIEVGMVHGHYGEFRVLVDGETVVDGGPWAALGILPPGSQVITRLRERLSLER